MIKRKSEGREAKVGSKMEGRNKNWLEGGRRIGRRQENEKEERTRGRRKK